MLDGFTLLLGFGEVTAAIAKSFLFVVTNLDGLRNVFTEAPNEIDALAEEIGDDGTSDRGSTADTGAGEGFHVFVSLSSLLVVLFYGILNLNEVLPLVD